MNHQQMVKPIVAGGAVLAGLALAGVNVGAFIPYLFLLACPLMMIFMMRGMGQGEGHGGGCHGGHAHDDERPGSERERSEPR